MAAVALLPVLLQARWWARAAKRTRQVTQDDALPVVEPETEP